MNTKPASSYYVLMLALQQGLPRKSIQKGAKTHLKAYYIIWLHLPL